MKEPPWLVHEAYLRLIDASRVDWKDRAHFFAVATRMMRRILIDAARARGAKKRGGAFARVEGPEPIDLDSLAAAGTDTAAELARAWLGRELRKGHTRDR